MTARSIVWSLGLLAMVATTGCGNPFEVKPNFESFDDTLAVYGLSEGPANGPSAVVTCPLTPLGRCTPIAVRTDPSERYDVVFDIRTDSAGNRVAYVLPPRAVGLFGSAGLIKDTARRYEEILQAPSSGYDDSTGVAVKPGDVILVQAQSAQCAGQLVAARQFIYSKLVIDSVNTSPYDPFANPAGSSIYFRIRVDPNCGFLSFADGIPRF
jgi:hypothetical protein